MIDRSNNCSNYTDTLSVLVESKYSVAGFPGCSVSSQMLSCQTSAFEKPDAITAELMRSQAVATLDDMGCDTSKMEVSHQTNLIGAQQLEYSGKQLSALGMASNCSAVGNDANDTTHTIRAVCTNQYEMQNDAGDQVRDTNKKFYSSLSSCDVSEEAMPQLMEDARKVARYQAASNGFHMDRDRDLACTFSVLPHR